MALNGIEQLCPHCGLCCDSTLFADVELGKGDDSRRLLQLGLPVGAKTKTKLACPQPCAAFDGCRCRVYAERPGRCRQFECGLLKRVNAGELKPAPALKKIRAARALAEKVRSLLRACGQHDEPLPLTLRYAAAMSAAMDLSVESEADRRGELMLAVNDLMQLLQRDFLR